MKVKKSYSPIKSGMFYVVNSKYFIPKKESECFFILENNNDKFNICITKILLTSIVTTIWDINFDEIYVEGGSNLELISLNRVKQDIENYPKGIRVISTNRENYSPIKKIGESKKGLYKVTQAYKTEEILGGDEIILGNSNSVCIYVRQESGVTAPVNCEVRFYIE